MTHELLIALTLWYEARSEGPVGMQAVASVIYLRAYARGGTAPPSPHTLARVCSARKQFSCWELRDGQLRPTQRAVPREDDAQFIYCKQLARNMVTGMFVPTVEATHYHASSVRPYWASSMSLVSRIGNHLFYKE